MVLKLTEQLEIFGLEETQRRAQGEAVSASECKRLQRRVETAHQLMSALPAAEDLSSPSTIEVLAMMALPSPAELASSHCIVNRHCAIRSACSRTAPIVPLAPPVTASPKLRMNALNELPRFTVRDFRPSVCRWIMMRRAFGP